MANTTLVIDFEPMGEVQAMHYDSFPLGFLGPQKIVRASELVFDEEAQHWTICVSKSANGREFNPPVMGATGFSSYEQARAVEVAWFNEARKADTRPDSLAGVCILARIRKEVIK